MSTNFHDVDDLISQSEAARLRGVSRQAISNLIAKGKLRSFSIGGKILLSRIEVMAFEPDPPGRPNSKDARKK